MSERMTFAECAEKAKDADSHDSATFDVVGVGGRASAKWLDAYFGLFIIDGENGFSSGKEAEAHGLWCENFKVKD